MTLTKNICALHNNGIDHYHEQHHHSRNLFSISGHKNKLNQLKLNSKPYPVTYIDQAGANVLKSLKLEQK